MTRISQDNQRQQLINASHPISLHEHAADSTHQDTSIQPNEIQDRHNSVNSCITPSAPTPPAELDNDDDVTAEVTNSSSQITLLHPISSADAAPLPIEPNESDDAMDNTMVEQETTPVPLDTSSHVAFIKQIRRGMKYAVSWSSVLSFLSVTGRIRFSRDQYWVMNSAIKTSSAESSNMLSYSSARQNQTSYFTNSCFPPSKIIWIPCLNLPRTLARSISTVTTSSGDKKDVRECVKIIFPTSWARYDLSLFPLYEDVINGDHHTSRSKLSIERSPIVTNRAHSIGDSSSFWAQYQNTIVNVDKGTLLSVPVNDAIPEEINLGCWHTTVSDNGHSIACKIGQQWCVSKKGFQSRRSALMDQDSLTADELNIYHLFQESELDLEIYNKIEEEENKSRKSEGNRSSKRIKKNSTFSIFTSDASIFPTDICTFLRPSDESVGASSSSDHIVCVYVSSFVAKVTGQQSERVIWLSTKSSSSFTTTSTSTIRSKASDLVNLHFSLNVTAVPKVHEDNSTPIQLRTERTSSPRGVLSDGTRYVIYRFALYADEFGFNGICGCYLLLLGAAQHNRISSAGVRVLSLIPKHQNVNKVLNLIIDDILDGMVNGLPAKDPHGQDIRIFLDMCSVFGDYVKISAITNTSGHSGTSFCTYCRVSRSTNNLGPVYAYSTLIHSRRISFMRCDERQDILFAMNLSEKSRQKLGIRESNQDSANSIPMIRFSEHMCSSANNLAKTIDGQRVISPYFDSFLSTAVAPDHLITGLISVLLDACFKTLPNNNARNILQSAILQSAVDNSLPTQGDFLLYKGTTFLGIASITMSTLYVVFLFASKYFDDLKGTKYDTKMVFAAVKPLQDFISTLYYWPDIAVDDIKDIQSIHCEDKTGYLGALRDHAVLYSTAVSDHMKKYGDAAILKDKPNSHRLIELAVHTVPLFGHGRLTSELVLELTHRFFKTYFKQNNHTNTHITGLNLFTTRVWAADIYILYRMWTTTGRGTSSVAFRNLLHLFFGESVLSNFSAEMDNEDTSEIIEEFMRQLDSIFRPPVKEMLMENIPVAFMVDSVRWVPRYKKKGRDTDEFISTALRNLSIFRNQSLELLNSKTTFFERASLTVFAKYGMGQRTYAYKTIYRGTPISVFVNNEDRNKRVITSTSDGQGFELVLLVYSIFRYDGEPYIISFDLTNRAEDGGHVNRNRVRVVKLDIGISRLAYVFKGIESVLNGEENISVVRDGDALLGGKQCHLLFRCDGYPPCLG